MLKIIYYLPMLIFALLSFLLYLFLNFQLELWTNKIENNKIFRITINKRSIIVVKYLDCIIYINKYGIFQVIKRYDYIICVDF